LVLQVAFQPFRRGQLPENVFLLIDAEAPLHARNLKPVLQPQALFGIRYMREFRADGIGVNELEVGKNFPQRRTLRNRVIAAAVKNSVSRSASDKPKYCSSST